MKRFLLLTLWVIFILFTPSLSAAQNKELRLLTWHGYAPGELVAKFEKESGYTVFVLESNNEDMLAQLIISHGAGFDLAQPSMDRILSAQEAGGLYQPIDYSKINESNINPILLAAVKANTSINGKPYAVPFCWGAGGLIVNAKYAPGANSFTDLLNPQYASRISYRLKRQILVGMAFALGYNPFALYKNPPEYQKMLDAVSEKLISGKYLARNYWIDDDALVAALRKEDVYLAEGWDSTGFSLHKDNPDIDFVAPQSGALGWIDTFALPAGAKNIEAAHAWINFILRPENAAIITNTQKLATASKEAMTFVLPSIKADFDRCLPPSVVANIKWYPPLPAEISAMEIEALNKIRAAGDLPPAAEEPAKAPTPQNSPSPQEATPPQKPLSPQGMPDPQDTPPLKP